MSANDGDVTTQAPATRRSAPGDGDAPNVVDEVVDAEAPLEAGERSGDDAVTALVFDGGGEPQPLSLEEAAQAAGKRDRLAWVDLSEYDEDDLRQVAAALKLPERGVAGVVEGWRRPHLISFEDQFFVNVTVADADVSAWQVEARELDCFAGESIFVSAHKAPLPFVERIRERAQQSVDLVRGDSAFMLFIVLDELLIDYDHLAEEIEDEIERMEERALTEDSDRLLDDILHLKRFVFAVHRLAEQHREIFAAFLRPDFDWVAGEEVEPYFRDLQAHHADLLSGLASTRAGVNSAFEIYVSQVAHRTNNIVKLLTMVSVVLLPMAAIFGLFGTNFENSGLYTQENFWVMLGSVVLLAAGILALFRWQRWF